MTPTVGESPAESSSKEPQKASELHTDTLSSGVAYMLVMTVIQRAVGFIRTAIFCRLLSERELGQWSLAFSFVMLSSPLTVLGITGSFGRYVEHFRQQGQLRNFLRKTSIAATLLTVFAIVVLATFAPRFAWFVFGDPHEVKLLYFVIVAVVSTVCYNFLLETFISLRRPRTGSVMELIASWVFALAGIAASYFHLGSGGVIGSYIISTFAANVYGAFVLRNVWNDIIERPIRLPSGELWWKLAPFALSLWITNIFTNLFDMVDRYMIVHFSGIPADEAQGWVGQFYASITVPLLMVGVCTLLSRLVLPYLIKDWETGQTQAVSDHLNAALKLVAIVLSTGSVAILTISPVLFGMIFGGRYELGRVILPWTLMFCFWNGVVTMAYNYLYCVERTKYIIGTLACGLVTNVVLNLVLLPIWGLTGAAIATAVGTGVNLFLVIWISRRFGMQFDFRVLIPMGLPIALPLGATMATVFLLVAFWLSLKTEAVFSNHERLQVEESLQQGLKKLRRKHKGRISSAESAAAM